MDALDNLLPLASRFLEGRSASGVLSAETRQQLCDARILRHHALVDVLGRLTPEARKRVRDRHAKCQKGCIPLMLRTVPEFKACVHPRGASAGRAGLPDFRAQNILLAERLFDIVGNPLFDNICVMATFQIGEDRLSTIRGEKKAMVATPVVALSKAAIRPKDLPFIIHPPHGAIHWYAQLSPMDFVTIKRRPFVHGLEGRVSGNFSAERQRRFLEFVDANTTPSGRTDPRSGPAFFFDVQFSRLSARGQDELHLPLTSSVVDTYNAAVNNPDHQVSSATAAAYMAEHRPSVALRPNNTDYCDTCAALKVAINSAEQSLRRSQGVLPEADIEPLQAQLQSLKERKREHKRLATEAREHYNSAIAASTAASRAIARARSNAEAPSQEHLDTPLVMSYDYQQEHLLPFFNLTQPGATYFRQKLSIHCLGVVIHDGLAAAEPDLTAEVDPRQSGRAFIYLTTEHTGSKTNDHTLSHLTEVLQHVPTSARRLHLYADNARTTKSTNSLGWAYQVLRATEIKEIRFSFMVPGHTKFAPDQLFARIGHAKKGRRVDIVNEEELRRTCEVSGTTAYLVEPAGVRLWRDFFAAAKMRVASGIDAARELRLTKLGTDIVVEMSSVAGGGGSWQRVTLFPKGAPDTFMPASVTPRQALNPRLLKELALTYRDVVPRERWPPWLEAEVRAGSAASQQGTAALQPPDAAALQAPDAAALQPPDAEAQAQ